MALPRAFEDAPAAAAGTFLVRCGCELTFHAEADSTGFAILTPQSEAGQVIREVRFELEPAQTPAVSHDLFGNQLHRIRIQRGRNRLKSDLVAAVPALPEPWGHGLEGRLDERTPTSQFRFALPSRYCNSDRLGAFALERFGALPNDAECVRAITDWTHRNIEYRTGSGSPLTSASEIIAQGWGVCRDFAHVAVALTRCFSIPARYVTGYVPEIGVVDPGTPNDFHAYFQAWLGGAWHTFDARFNQSRFGRVHIAQGLDAVDVAFLTTLCGVSWERFEVWSYQVAPDHATLDRPVDLGDRLCGTPTVRFQ